MLAGNSDCDNANEMKAVFGVLALEKTLESENQLRRQQWLDFDGLYSGREKSSDDRQRETLFCHQRSVQVTMSDDDVVALMRHFSYVSSVWF